MTSFPLSLSRARKAMWMLVLGAAAAMAAPASAQFGLTGGIGDAFRPAFTSRDIQLAVEMLQLDEAQRFILETLFEDYQTEFRTGVDGFRDRISGLRDDIDPDNPDPGQIMRVVFGSVDEWRVESQEIAERFLSDLKGLLNTDPLASWTQFERRMFRDKYLKNGQLAGENLDLTTEVHLLDIAETQMQALRPMLDEYETELDKALKAREDYSNVSQTELINAARTDDPQVSFRIAERQVELRVAVRDVNERYVDVLGAALPPEAAKEFLDSINMKLYPRIYQATQAERVFKAALVLPDLAPETKTAISDLYDRYQVELATYNNRLVQLTREYQPAEIKAKVEQAAARLSGARPERPADPTRDEFTKRNEMSQGYVDQLRALLSPEQFTGLPGARRWMTPEERSAMGPEGTDETALPNSPEFRGNKLDRARQSSLASPGGEDTEGGDKEPVKKKEAK